MRGRTIVAVGLGLVCACSAGAQPKPSTPPKTGVAPLYDAPDVSNDAVGAVMPSPDAFTHFVEHGRWRENPAPFVIMRGPHGFLVQFLGVTERAAIAQEYEAMLARLCTLRREWCLPQ